MAITSIGYDGTIDEVAWVKLQKASASVYGVSTPDSWKVTAVTGADRTISIAPGSGWGHHVFDESNSNYTLQGAAVSSGSRWDMVVLRRDWTSNAGGPSAFRLNPGNASQALASRTNDPGVRDDQPIALVQFTAGKTQPNAIIDLRTWASNGGAEVADKLALGYLGVPGAAVKLGTSTWRYERQANGVWGWKEYIAADATAPLFRHGFKVVWTNVDGFTTVPFDTHFPNTCIVAVGAPMNPPVNGSVLQFISAGAGGANFRCFDLAGNPLKSQRVGIGYIATGN